MTGNRYLRVWHGRRPESDTCIVEAQASMARQMKTQTTPNPRSNNATLHVMRSDRPVRGMNVYELIETHPLVRRVRAGEQLLGDDAQSDTPRVSLADVHMHTNYSDGTGSVEDVLEHVAQATPLDVIAITDHDTIEGALRARELAARRDYGFEVIVGEEISTREGHCLRSSWSSGFRRDSASSAASSWRMRKAASPSSRIPSIASFATACSVASWTASCASPKYTRTASKA